MSLFVNIFSPTVCLCVRKVDCLGLEPAQTWDGPCKMSNKLFNDRGKKEAKEAKL